MLIPNSQKPLGFNHRSSQSIFSTFVTFTLTLSSHVVVTLSFTVSAFTRGVPAIKEITPCNFHYRGTFKVFI